MSLLTRTETRKSFDALEPGADGSAATISPGGASSGAEKSSGGRPASASGGRISPSSRPSPRMVTRSSIGSPTRTTVRSACTSIEYDVPTALRKLFGWPVCGSGRISSRRALSSALKARVRATGNPKESRPMPTCICAITRAGGRSRAPDLSGVASAWKRKRVYSMPSSTARSRS